MTVDRNRAASLAFDLACVLVMVVIGTRNHDTDTGLGGVLFVAAPFFIAAVAARAVPTVRSSPAGATSGLTVWVTTVAGGMILRRFVFDRGTALAFIIVASVFLGATMMGWRALAARRRAA